MTNSRPHLTGPADGYYHICSRCVRQAFLCGDDPYTRQNFDHRRVWLEKRMLSLSEVFAIDVIGYAVLPDHYHMVLNLSPSEAVNWSAQKVADRWMRLNPRKNETARSCAARKSTLQSNPDQIAITRERLGSLSWFMQHLNQPIARLANKEDGCKGRFWEGRSKSSHLTDKTAVLAVIADFQLKPLGHRITEHFLKTQYASLSEAEKSKAPAEPNRNMIAKPHQHLHFDSTLREFAEQFIVQ